MTTSRSLSPRRALAVALLAGALAAGASPACVLAADTAEVPATVAPRIAALLGESSLDHQIEDLAVKLRESTEEGFAGVPGVSAATLERARESAATAFEPDRLRAVVASHLDAALDARDVARLLDYYRSPLGRRGVAAERERDPDADRAAYERFTSTYGATAVEQERLQAFGQMMDEANIAERMTGLVMDMQLATIYGAMAVAPPEMHAGIETMVAQIDAQRPAVGSMMETVLPLHLAWVMDGFTQAELGELLVIGRRPEQQRLLDAWMGGLRTAFVGAMAGFLPRLAEAERFAETHTEI